MEEIDKKEQINSLVKKLKHNSESLHISRLPIQSKRKFVELANTEFAGDFGMCLKWMLDGLVNPDFQELYAAINDLNSRIEVLESKIENPVQNSEDKSETKIKTLSGKIIRE